MYFLCEEKQCKSVMILLCPVQGPWASSLCSHYFVSVTAVGTVRALVAKLYVRLRFIHSLFRASTFPVLKLSDIVILWVYYTIPFGFSFLYYTFWASIFNFLNYFDWLSITDEGSVPEMRIWSILLIKFD